MEKIISFIFLFRETDREWPFQPSQFALLPGDWLRKCRSLCFYCVSKMTKNPICNSHFFFPVFLLFIFLFNPLSYPPLTLFPNLPHLLYPSSHSQIDRLEVSGLGQTPLAVSCGADSSFPGGEDGTPDPQRTKQAIAQLQQKILKLTEQIKIEQTARDDNVAEYLKLANNADKQQSTRIKQVK